MNYNNSVLSLFEEKRFVKVCAPMVRYSKLQFRTLVRQFDCDLCFSSMIIADSFCKSDKARNNELKLNEYDKPLIVQFAASNVNEFVNAAYMISPYCDGVDLNCGCPQRWAKQMGLGCVMLQKPELIADIIKQCRNRIPAPFAVSVKTRILPDMKKTVDICKQLDNAGASFITIHARTPDQQKGDIDEDALKVINECVSCPIIANGGIRNLADCNDLHEKTGCKGIMVASGILTNPMIFSGEDMPSIKCIKNWLDICYNSTLDLNDYKSLKEQEQHCYAFISEKPKNLTFQCFHHHLVFMLEKVLPKAKRRIFNNLQCFGDVLDFIFNEFDLRPQLYDIDVFKKNSVLHVDYRSELSDGAGNFTANEYDSESSNGKYFLEKFNEVDTDLSLMYSEENY